MGGTVPTLAASRARARTSPCLWRRGYRGTATAPLGRGHKGFHLVRGSARHLTLPTLQELEGAELSPWAATTGGFRAAEPARGRSPSRPACPLLCTIRRLVSTPHTVTRHLALDKKSREGEGLTFAFFGALTRIRRLFREGLSSNCSITLSKSSWDFSGIRSWKGLEKPEHSTVTPLGKQRNPDPRRESLGTGRQGRNPRRRMENRALMPSRLPSSSVFSQVLMYQGTDAKHPTKTICKEQALRTHHQFREQGEERAETRPEALCLLVRGCSDLRVCRQDVLPLSPRQPRSLPGTMVMQRRPKKAASCTQGLTLVDPRWCALLLQPAARALRPPP